MTNVCARAGRRHILIEILKILIAAAVIFAAQHILNSIDWGVDNLEGYPWTMELARLVKNVLYGAVMVLFVFDHVIIKDSKYNRIPLIMLGIFAILDLLCRSVLLSVTPFFILEFCVGNSMYFQLAFGIWATLLIKSKHSAQRA